MSSDHTVRSMAKRAEESSRYHHNLIELLSLFRQCAQRSLTIRALANALEFR